MNRLLALSLVFLVAAPVSAQPAGTLTLAQVERKYRGMKTVHIEKCDYDHDDLFTRSEQLCLAGIYQQMYLDRD